MLSCLAPGAPPQTPLTGLRTLRNRAGTITAYDSSFMLAVVACFWGMYVVADISYCGSKSWSSIICTTSPLAKSWIRACIQSLVLSSLIILQEESGLITCLIHLHLIASCFLISSTDIGDTSPSVFRAYSCSFG